MIPHKIKYVLICMALLTHQALADIDPIVRTSNLFVIADASVKVSNIQDNVIIQGNGSFLSDNIGSLTNLGNLTLNNVNIRGNLTVGGTLTQNNSHAGTITYLTKPGPDYNAINKILVDDSRFLGSLSTNGSIEINSINKVITLTGTSPKLNVFETRSLWFNYSLQINAPKGSTVVINMPDEQIEMSRVSLNKPNNMNSGFDPTHVLLNFPQARAISLTASTIAGTILAPLSNVSAQAVNIRGSLFAQSLTMSTSNMYEDHFQGQLPTDESRTLIAPEPQLTWLISVLLYLALAIQRKRHQEEGMKAMLPR